MRSSVPDESARSRWSISAQPLWHEPRRTGVPAGDRHAPPLRLHGCLRSKASRAASRPYYQPTGPGASTSQKLLRRPTASPSGHLFRLGLPTRRNVLNVTGPNQRIGKRLIALLRCKRKQNGNAVSRYRYLADWLLTGASEICFSAFCSASWSTRSRRITLRAATTCRSSARGAASRGYAPSFSTPGDATDGVIHQSAGQRQKLTFFDGDKRSVL